MQPKTTAKDFFVYLSGFAALYVSVISLISLLFTIINKWFPDALNYSYYYFGDAYSGGMRFAIASLIIVFPIYLIIASYLNRYLIANPDRKDVAVRKWLAYLTLFLTAVAVIVDLVVLLNTFLGGEITIRFVLKVLAVLIVTGAVFWYYFYDLRKNFEPTMPKRTGLIVSLACVLVFGSLVLGFVTLGSPMKARALRFDERRVTDLMTIQNQVIYSNWQQKGVLPNSLADLSDSISGFSAPLDPETGKPYVYEKTGNLSFKLCADFKLPTPENMSRGGSSMIYPMEGGNDSWKHAAGRTCFDRTIDPDRYPVYQKPTILR